MIVVFVLEDTGLYLFLLLLPTICWIRLKVLVSVSWWMDWKCGKLDLALFSRTVVKKTLNLIVCWWVGFYLPSDSLQVRWTRPVLFGLCRSNGDLQEGSYQGASGTTGMQVPPSPWSATADSCLGRWPSSSQLCVAIWLSLVVIASSLSPGEHKV